MIVLQLLFKYQIICECCQEHTGAPYHGDYASVDIGVYCAVDTLNSEDLGAPLDDDENDESQKISKVQISIIDEILIDPFHFVLFYEPEVIN